jgi:hypothetical protein
MQADDSLSGTKPLPGRIKIGLVATALTVVLLIYPGLWELPLSALAVLLPRGCSNGFVALILLPGLALNLILMMVGVGAVVSAAQGVKAGLVLAILFDAVVATLFLIPSFTFPWTQADRDFLYRSAWTALAAVIPLLGATLLLAPRAYASRRAFVVMVIVSGVMLAPGVVGVIAFGLRLTGVISPPPHAVGCA